jgi:outer membrane protein assembly factor BamA
MERRTTFFLALQFLLMVQLHAQNPEGLGADEEKDSFVESLFGLADRTVELLSTDRWTFIPALTYSPETRLGIGARAVKIFQTGTDSSFLANRPSSLPLTFLYTLNHQMIVTGELELWMDQNTSFLNARIEFSDYPFQFSGIGNAVFDAEPYASRYFYTHLYYEKEVARGFYLGPRYEFRTDDLYQKVPGGLLDAGTIPGSNGQRLSGLGLAVNLDRRDNIFQPRRGAYHQWSWMIFHSHLGSNFNFMQWVFDFRKYWPLPKDQVLVGQARLSLTQGEVPFQHLSMMGGSDLMRGYFEGRYRDRHAMVYQAEWRFPVYRNLRMVAFGSAGQVGREAGDFGFNGYLRWGGGIGFRYRLTEEGLQLRFDLAYGDRPAFYFGLNEVM